MESAISIMLGLTVGIGLAFVLVYLGEQLVDLWSSWRWKRRHK